MPINNQTIGKDVSVNIVTSTGNFTIPPAAITKFDATPDTSTERRKGLDGISRFAVYPDGWKGSLEIDRFDSTVDDYWAQYESDYYAGRNLQPATITETIQEPSGAITQYRYTGVLFDLKDIGAREPDKIIKQKVDFVASRRIKVA